MNQPNQKKRLLLISIPLLCILAAGAFFQRQLQMTPTVAEQAAAEEIEISLDSGFYTQNQSVKVTVPAGATVYYTDNFEEPTAETGKVYKEPIALLPTETEMIYGYRFKAYYADGRESETINRTYICGTEVDARYTNNVLCVFGDPDGLFGYENGIFVPGKIFDEFMAANPQAVLYENVDANFMQRGDDTEREVYIEYFTPRGSSLMSQECGIRVYGNLSRVKHRKSFRLYARKEYDVQNEFDYPVIPDFVSEADGTVAKEHKRLVVRNAGNDSGVTYLRNELALRLADEAGFQDVMYAEPVCVYINGIYYGVYWLENGYDAQYFINKYGEHEGEFVVLEGSDNLKSADEDPTVQKYVEEYNALYQKFGAMDLTIEENYQALAKVLDIENYLQYYAIEYYLGNGDWPQNNVRAYRYVSPHGNYQEGTVFDGRYRHMLYDLDYAFGLRMDPEEEYLTEIVTSGYPLFKALVERQDCRDYFASYVCDLFNGAMSTEHVKETLAEMHASREAELRYMFEEGSLLEDPLWWEPTAQSYTEFEENYQVIVDYAELHPGTAYSDMTMYWGYDFGKWFCLNVTKNGFSDLKVNTVFVDKDTFIGWYIGDIPLELTPVMAKNEVFDYWLVNGEVREGENLTLTYEDIVEGQMYVEMVVHTVEEPVLQINALKSKGASDYIELINCSDQNISTRGYYLSDTEDIHRYMLPTTIIGPGETRRFYGKDCMDVEALGQSGMNFNIKTGETITLTYGTEVLESVVLPDLSQNGVYKWNDKKQKFIEEFGQ
ncbi:MAG: CotH kinase family protein [Lachnospiraceae bacterium]|nr:CotH kinase family protein [Lachnospiraceae bacterium]